MFFVAVESTHTDYGHHVTITSIEQTKLHLKYSTDSPYNQKVTAAYNSTSTKLADKHFFNLYIPLTMILLQPAALLVHGVYKTSSGSTGLPSSSSRTNVVMAQSAISLLYTQ
jgi:hypothetical protein